MLSNRNLAQMDDSFVGGGDGAVAAAWLYRLELIRTLFGK